MTAAGAAADTGNDERPWVVVVGGSTRWRGGLELFCERACAALDARGAWRVSPLPADTAHLGLARLPLLARRINALVRLIRQRPYAQRPTAVWVQYANMPDLLLVLAARLAGGRVLVTPHLGVQWRSRANPLLRWLSTRALGAAHALALIAPTQEAELSPPAHLPRYAIRTFLPQAVVAGGVAPGQPADVPLRLIHAGRLSREKGTLLFIALCAALTRAGVAFSAQLAGTPAPGAAAEIDQAIAVAALGDRLIRSGQLDQPALIAALAASDVLIHASVQDSYPLIMLEALACGTLPLCLGLPGATHIATTYDGAVLAPAEATADTVIAAARAWLETTPLAAIRTRGQAAAAMVRADFAWTSCADLLGHALGEVADAVTMPSSGHAH